MLESAKLWGFGTNWYNFLTTLMVHYHRTEFAVPSISLSRDMSCGQK